jgi:hypothetical protein
MGIGLSKLNMNMNMNMKVVSIPDRITARCDSVALFSLHSLQYHFYCVGLVYDIAQMEREKENSPFFPGGLVNPTQDR